MSEASADRPLLELLRALDARGYDFVTPLNPTIRANRRRRQESAERDLRDVLGWSLAFRPGQLDGEIEALMLEAGVLEERREGYCPTVRVSRVRGVLFLHSAFPANGEDAVFLGPDSYRFAEFLHAELGGGGAVRSAWDIGAGAGVGGVIAARLAKPVQLYLSDVNSTALQLARVNAAHAGLSPRMILGPGLHQCDAPLDLVVANPPFIAAGPRTYSDGGNLLGAQLSLDWAIEAMERLAPGGRLLLYTGSAIVEGKDQFREVLHAQAAERGCALSYRELDPDIFSSELKRPEYAGAERIAAVGAVITRP